MVNLVAGLIAPLQLSIPVLPIAPVVEIHTRLACNPDLIDRWNRRSNRGDSLHDRERDVDQIGEKSVDVDSSSSLNWELEFIHFGELAESMSWVTRCCAWLAEDEAKQRAVLTGRPQKFIVELSMPN